MTLKAIILFTANRLCSACCC